MADKEIAVNIDGTKVSLFVKPIYTAFGNKIHLSHWRRTCSPNWRPETWDKRNDWTCILLLEVNFVLIRHVSWKVTPVKDKAGSNTVKASLVKCANCCVQHANIFLYRKFVILHCKKRDRIKRIWTYELWNVPKSVWRLDGEFSFWLLIAFRTLDTDVAPETPHESLKCTLSHCLHQ